MNPVCRVALAATVATMVAMLAVAAPSAAAPSAAAPSAAAQAPAQQPAAPPSAAQQPPPAQPAAPPQEPQDPKYEETVVVSASKTEQKLVDAPATMTVIGAEQIENATSQNFAELLRTVPGLNITQVSARDINVTSRAPTGTLATGQLAVLDGRSLYQDFFGFVMWDFLPVNLNEIKQIEVIRGPASAVWGANAVFGVINVITKSPREMQGTSATFGLGTFERTGNDADARIVVVRERHARAAPSTIAGRSSCRPAATRRIRLSRPTGIIPGSPAPGTPVSPYTNSGTTQPKFDGRVDYDYADGAKLSFSGGVAGTEGIMHSGIGPFDINSGSLMAYGRVGYQRQGAPRGRVRAAPRRRRDQSDRPRPNGRVHPVRIQDEHDGRGVVERECVCHPPRRHLRRQPAAQHVRSLDCAAERQPHGVRRLRPGRDLPVESFPLDARRAGRPLRLPGRTWCSRRGPRS